MVVPVTRLSPGTFPRSLVPAVALGGVLLGRGRVRARGDVSLRPPVGQQGLLKLDRAAGPTAPSDSPALHGVRGVLDRERMPVFALGLGRIFRSRDFAAHHVFVVGDGLKVVGTNAPRVPAQVVYVEARRERPDEQLVRDSVRPRDDPFSGLIQDPDSSVPPGFGRHPLPAGVGNEDLVEKPRHCVVAVGCCDEPNTSVPRHGSILPRLVKSSTIEPSCGARSLVYT